MSKTLESNAFLYLIDSIYKSVSSNDGWSALLADIRAAVSARIAILAITSQENAHEPYVIAQPTRLTTQEKLQVAGLIRSLTANVCPGWVSVVSDAPEAKSISDKFFSDAFVLLAVVAKVNGEKCSIILLLPGSSLDQLETASELLKMIIPHIQTAFVLKRELVLNCQKVDHLEKMLSVSGIPKAMVNSSLKVEEFNNAFERLANKKGSPISIDSDYLDISDDGMRQGVDRLLIQASLNPSDANLAWIKDTTRSRGWFIRLDPARVKKNNDSRLVCLPEAGETKFILSLYRAGEQSNLTPSIVGAVLNLSPAEARLALDLSNGFAPSEIAQNRGIAKNTVHNQLNSVMARHGLHRQGQLVSFISVLAFFAG
jgi:DNA-binding CsgD family transcriptional regulator